MVSNGAAGEGRRIRPKHPSNMITMTFFAVYILLSFTTRTYVDAFSTVSGVGTRTASSSSSSLFNTNSLITVISTERSMTTLTNGKRNTHTQMNMFRRRKNCNDDIGGANGAVRKWGKNIRLKHAFKSLLNKVQHKTNLLHLWTRKHKSRTLVTAMLLFSTILHSTSFTNIAVEEQQEQQQQQQIQAVSTGTTKSSATNLQQVVNRGGGGSRTSTISSSSPGRTMKNFLQQAKKEKSTAGICIYPYSYNV